jgi:hypothetical protein
MATMPEHAHLFPLTLKTNEIGASDKNNCGLNPKMDLKYSPPQLSEASRFSILDCVATSAYFLANFCWEILGKYVFLV